MPAVPLLEVEDTDLRRLYPVNGRAGRLEAGEGRRTGCCAAGWAGQGSARGRVQIWKSKTGAPGSKDQDVEHADTHTPSSSSSSNSAENRRSGCATTRQ